MEFQIQEPISQLCPPIWMQDTAVQSMRLLPQHRAGGELLPPQRAGELRQLAGVRLAGTDARAAARGGLLHDFYLYNWRDAASHPGIRHGSQHPEVALRNARARFSLTWREEDIILSHMFPYTPTKVYRCLESAVVSTMDKLCAAAELVGLVPPAHPLPPGDPPSGWTPTGLLPRCARPADSKAHVLGNDGFSFDSCGCGRRNSARLSFGEGFSTD